MRSSTEKLEELDLELPDLDGSEDLPEAEAAHDALDIAEDDGGNPFDDATAEDAAPAEVTVDGAERGWLEDAEDATHLDVGPFDVLLQPEGRVLEDDEADGRHHLDDDGALEEAFVADAGEEGPLADDEELREEDLPALDADEDGDVADEELYDRAALGSGVVEDDLRWDDRAWARVSEPDHDPALVLRADDADDSGLLAVPSEDPLNGARDATWKILEEGGRVMAATFVPGDSVVLALRAEGGARALLVRVQPDGEARIIAEIDASRLARVDAREKMDDEDDGAPCLVTFVRWDAARGCLFVGGNFGVDAYRPMHTTGAIYAQPDQDFTRVPANPPGQWNAFAIRVQGGTYTVTLNRQQVTRFENQVADRGVPSAPNAPAFGGLQTHTGNVAYRNIRIRAL